MSALALRRLMLLPLLTAVLLGVYARREGRTPAGAPEAASSSPAAHDEGRGAERAERGPADAGSK